MKTLLRATARIFILAIIVCIALGFSYLPEANCASIIDEVTEVLKSGTPTLELRLGYEYSDLQDNHKDSAKALNLRTRVGYRTGEYLNSSVYVQLHNLTTLADHYAPEDKDYDVIADPEGSRVHQAYLDFKGLPDTTLRLGRQVIILDDARLIGNVGWRQNGQSFDAVSLTNTSIKNLKLYGPISTKSIPSSLIISIWTPWSSSMPNIAALKG